MNIIAMAKRSSQYSGTKIIMTPIKDAVSRLIGRANEIAADGIINYESKTWKIFAESRGILKYVNRLITLISSTTNETSSLAQPF
jgi:uncharacterized protein YbjQ (UPF0145 family)